MTGSASRARLGRWLALLAVAWPTGCALGTSNVRIERSPLPPFPADLRPDEPVDLLVRPLRDLRPAHQRGLVGRKINRYRQPMGRLAIEEGQSLGVVLAEHLAAVLRHVGHRAASQEDAASRWLDFEPVAYLEGEVAEFWMDFETSYWHKVALDVRLEDAAGEVLWSARLQGDEVASLLPGYRAIVRAAVDEALVHAIAEFGSAGFREALKDPSATPP